MSFNSVPFIFGFLPATIIFYYVLALTPFHRLRLPFLILATLAFYAHGSLEYLPLLVFSITANYVIGGLIVRSGTTAARVWLWVGVAANVVALLWFKYAVFKVANLDALFNADLFLARIALPLGISFYTFQQIAFLVDLSRGRSEAPPPISYFAYVLFFPQLLAGPISFSREIIPQMSERPAWTVVPANLLIGLTIFGLGMFKKTVIADTAALWTGPMFDAAATGATPVALAAWGGALAYTLQIYFDFSGYSDMAIGTARMFGVLLPLNFHSPLRSTSIIDLWRRWHITLGRFVQIYIFQPLAVPLARFCASRSLGGGLSVVLSTLLPTFFSMLIIGSWHGASWTFVLFGALHGTYMIINEGWNYLTRKRRKKQIFPRWRVALAGGGTLLCFVVASVPFRAADVPTALRIFAGMIGFKEGPAVWDTWPVLTPLGPWGLFPLLVFGFAGVYLLPNTQQIMTLVTPALEWTKWRNIDPAMLNFHWRPTPAWAFAGGAVLLFGIIFVARGTTQFVYFAF
jgi:alginate O-acetyltransferase complex protein AlgI